MATSTSSSPFLTPHTHTTPNTLSIIHLKRDQRVPLILSSPQDDTTETGYAEGAVLNTRFGSFPHSTLADLPWGSQVRASKVDTGSRGKKGKKRKRGDVTPSTEAGAEADVSDDTPNSATRDGAAKETVVADSGFVHILPPTPENWTASLPHRTQIVYTSDYSYILQRLRVRPGTKIIEAGAGSGSFSHAAARAVFDGYPQKENGTENEAPINGNADHGEDQDHSRGDTDNHKQKHPNGKVYSFEFHAQRYEKLNVEIASHGLQDVIHITHRDVCQDGFLIGPNQDESPNAEAVFLDLPAPWIALPHLSRRPQQTSRTPIPDAEQSEDTATNIKNETEASSPPPPPRKSPLSPTTAIRLCTFSPCIEQVQRTVSTLRRLGWIDISMVEIANKRIDIRRERGGITAATAGPNAVLAPASVDEAVSRLREIEKVWKDEAEAADEAAAVGGDGGRKQKKKKNKGSENGGNGNGNNQGGTRLSGPAAIEAMIKRKTYKDGYLVHRTEPEVKTHTSYLVFAILPREWSEEDEERVKRRIERREAAKTKEEENEKGKTEKKGDDVNDDLDVKAEAEEGVKDEIQAADGDVNML